ELLQVGKEFGLATPATSLLVLETVEQYLDHGIEPPRSRAKVFAEWNARIEDRKVKTTKSKEERLAAVVAKWNERVAWWEKEYKVPPNFVYAEPPQKPGQAAVARMMTAEAPTTAEALAPAEPRPEALKSEGKKTESKTDASSRPASRPQ